MSKRSKSIKVTYKYRWENPTPDQLRESQHKLDSVYDFFLQKIAGKWGSQPKEKSVSEREGTSVTPDRDPQEESK